jgi:hypothetical protein
MPSLIRFVILLIFIAGVVYGGMIALVAFVPMEQREVTVRLPANAIFGTEQQGSPARQGLPQPITQSAPANTTQPENTAQ